MDYTPKSLASASPRGTSKPENHIMFERAPTYTSTVRETSHNSDFPQSTDGLGISFGDMEVPFGQLSLCPPPGSYTFPPAGWSDQILPADSLCEPALGINHLSPGTCYESYSGQTDVSASPLSFYSAQTFSASPTYSTTMDIEGTCDALPDQLCGAWPSTFIKMEEEPDNNLDRPLFPNGSHLTDAPMLAQNPQPVVHGSQFVREDSNDRLRESGQKMERMADRSPQSPPHGLQGIEPLRKENIPSANGLQCTMCGTRFTRRSNCREHMKRHDPALKKPHPCSQCERAFGRRSDLQRHVDSIHRGLRKFACELCERRFTRQDTLSRHRADGCERKQRKPRVLPKLSATNEQPLPSPTASPESHKHSIKNNGSSFKN